MARYTNKRRKPIISGFIKKHPKPAAAVAVGLALTGFAYYGNSHEPYPSTPAPITSPETHPSRPTSFGCDHLSLAKQNGGWLITLVTKGPTPEGPLHMEFSAGYTGNTPDIHNKVVDGLSTLIPLGGLISVEGGVIDPGGQQHHCLHPVRP